MKRIVFPLLALVLTMALALATTACCCGEEFNEGFKEGWNQSISQEFTTMKGMLDSVEDSEEKDRIKALLDEGEADAPNGNYSVVKVGVMKGTLQNHVADGELSKDEADELEDLYNDSKE